MMTFTNDMKSLKEWELKIMQGYYDRPVFGYLTDLLIENDRQPLKYDASTYFEIESFIENDDEIMYISLGDFENSGYPTERMFERKMSVDMLKIALQLQSRINNIYQDLLRLI